MQYNSTTYNGGEYNLTAHDVNLFDSVTETDDLTKEAGIVKTESQASVDALSDGVSLAAMLDTITILHRASYGNPYNSFSYNESAYNGVFDDDEVLLSIGKVLDDSLSTTDVLAPFVLEKNLAETIASVDVITSVATTKSLLEFLFVSELFSIQVTNKAVGDTIRLADWLSIERSPASDNWGD